AGKILPKLGSNHTIIKLHKNQGYGGNQKVCYRYAIEHGYDCAVLLHGDGQYAPELVTKFPSFLEDKCVDVVLGSRMKDKVCALRGNMPWYKFCGNIFLTLLQNMLSKQKISEYHTGYRAYRTDFLKRIPFELNSDDFHFDTDILLQAFHMDAKIFEFAIPTFYGDEICRVPLFKYAHNVISTTLSYRMQKLGLMVSLKFPHSANKVYRDKTDDSNSTHAHAIKDLNSICGRAGKKVLDIGCGTGFLEKKIKHLNLQYKGLDKKIPKIPTKSFQQFDLENEKWEIDISEYDCVLLLDVIEHLSDPERFLIEMRNQMKQFKTTKILISTANIGFVLVRMNLLFGQFNYADRGILDITHKRLFTKSSFKKLLVETGYEVKKIHGIGIPFKTLGKGWFFGALSKLSGLMARFYPSLFAFQFYAQIKPKMTTYQLIGYSSELNNGSDRPNLHAVNS
ncbi:MAG: methyltransferase domain-containing protein, partial [Desulfobacteraceae bacterium]|nr:methyltransferase domain-containing protein [Desulfobacteraceae bacterium]